MLHRLESRVFVPEFATLEINSPGEPGVADQHGGGFPPPWSHPFLSEMRAAAQKRTRAMTERVNRYLDPLALDFDSDVAPLTPSGNATNAISARLRTQGGRAYSRRRTPRGVLDPTARRRAGGRARNCRA